jgi:peroxiredoxin
MTWTRSLAMVVALGAMPALADPLLPDLALEATSGPSQRLRQTVAGAPFTVLVFFSDSCPCMAAHDRGLIELAQAYRARGVQVFLVDSEAGEALARDTEAVKRRHYPFPILADPGARLAKALGAEFATATVVFDAEGQVRYRGGIDSAKRETEHVEKSYLRDALEALVEGKRPAVAEAKTLGCYLRIY